MLLYLETLCWWDGVIIILLHYQSKVWTHLAIQTYIGAVYFDAMKCWIVEPGLWWVLWKYCWDKLVFMQKSFRSCEIQIHLLCEMFLQHIKNNKAIRKFSKFLGCRVIQFSFYHLSDKNTVNSVLSPSS